MRYLLALLLLTVPLGAQQTVVVPDVNVPITNVIDDIRVDVNLPPPNPEQVAREEAAIRAEERIADAIEAWAENCGCVNTGTPTVVQFANVGLTVAAFFIGWQLKGIKDKPNGDDIHNEGDTNVEVVIPPRQPSKPPTDESRWPHDGSGEGND